VNRPVVVVGAGALGSLLGALLSRVTRVQLVARGAHARAIHRQGGVKLSVTRPGLYAVDVAETVQPPPDSALVLITVKAFDLEAVLRPLAPLLDPSHLVVVLQNGLGIQRAAERLLGRPVVRAVTFLAAALEEPGHVAFNASGKTYFSHGGEGLDLWRGSGMPAAQVPDIDTYEWRKLAINAVINPLSAALGVPNGELLGLSRISRRLVKELVEVARREGQELETEETLAKVRSSMRQTARNRSSMLQDIGAGRRTEIDWINGAVVRLARKHGLEAPTHEMLLEIVHFVSQRAAGAARPARLPA
jgi:2-dehydropantoate 2-reductase